MGKLFVVMYHYTRDLKHSRYPEIKGLDVSLFREQIEFMKQQFNIVSMEQVIEAVERHADLPDKALLLTFDDGYVDNYTFAFPILEEFGIQGSFFIPGKTFATHQLLNVTLFRETYHSVTSRFFSNNTCWKLIFAIHFISPTRLNKILFFYCIIMHYPV